MIIKRIEENMLESANEFETRNRPYFKYYSKRQSEVKELSNNTKDKKIIYVETTESKIKIVFSKILFIFLKTIYIDKKQSLTDIELTIKNICNLLDLGNFDCVAIKINNWTLPVYSYRINNIYGKEVYKIS